VAKRALRGGGLGVAFDGEAHPVRKGALVTPAAAGEGRVPAALSPPPAAGARGAAGGEAARKERPEQEPGRGAADSGGLFKPHCRRQR
jgi:hypothetical protein